MRDAFVMVAALAIGAVLAVAVPAALAQRGGGVRPAEEAGGPPDPHKTSHQNGGADELSVAGLSGALGDDQVCDDLRTATTIVDVGSSAAPGVGDVLTATSDSAATWQAAGGGGCGGETSCDMNDDVATNYGASNDMSCFWDTTVGNGDWLCKAAADTDSYCIGYNCTSANIPAADSVMIGNGNHVGPSSVVIGNNAETDVAQLYNIAIGLNASTGSGDENSICIGNTSCNGDYCIAIGADSTTCTYPTSIMLGRSASDNDQANQMVVGDKNYPYDQVHFGHRSFGASQVMTDGASNNIATIAIANNFRHGGFIDYTAWSKDASNDAVATSGRATFAAVNAGFTEVCTIETNPTEFSAATGGLTLTNVWAIAAGTNLCQISVTPTFSGTSTGMELRYTITTLGDDARITDN